MEHGTSALRWTESERKGLLEYAALVAKELAGYGIDIAALSETRREEEGQLVKTVSKYTFFLD